MAYAGMTVYKLVYYHQNIHAAFPSTGCVRDIRIEGFVNISHRNWVRIGRCYERWQTDNLWADTEEERDRNILGYYDDIFSLRKLFGIEPYDEIQEEEPW